VWFSSVEPSPTKGSLWGPLISTLGEVTKAKLSFCLFPSFFKREISCKHNFFLRLPCLITFEPGGTFKEWQWSHNSTSNLLVLNYWAERLRGPSSSPSRVKNFRFSVWSRPALGAHQISNAKGDGRLFPRGVKRLSRETYLSPPTSVKVKKTWIYTSTAPYVFVM
jgi:hypothetical protein